MAVHVRMREDWMQLRRGTDAAIDGETAKFLQGSGKAWVTGGDPPEMAAHGIEADAEVGPPIPQVGGERVEAEVIRAGDVGEMPAAILDTKG